MPHRPRLGREQQTVDTAIFHTLELALHRARQFLVADTQLGGDRFAEIGNLLAAISLQLRRRGSEMGVGIDDHKTS